MYVKIIMHIRFRTFDSKTLIKRGLFMKARNGSRILLKSPHKFSGTASHENGKREPRIFLLLSLFELSISGFDKWVKEEKS